VELFTARYVDYDPVWGVAVRTTVGFPRGWRYGPLEHIRPVTPYGLLHIKSREAFAQQYLARLDHAGATAVEARLAGIAGRHGGRPLWLCCFEDLSKPGEWCHRTLLAEWIEERLGIAVTEVNGSPPPRSQLSLDLP
jgi:hypothetical protein